MVHSFRGLKPQLFRLDFQGYNEAEHHGRQGIVGAELPTSDARKQSSLAGRGQGHEMPSKDMRPVTHSLKQGSFYSFTLSQ